MTRLQGKHILITGAAHGIGLATTRRFAEEGARIIAVDTDDAGLRENASPFAALMHVADVTDQASIEHVVKTTEDTFGNIDGLVHYAGITRDAMHWKMALEDFERVLRVNLLGSFIVAQAVSRVMRQQKSGSIVLTASRVYLGNVGQANYSASKGAVVSLTRTLALELGRSNVRVNALAPGFIETRMTQNLPSDLREKAIQSTPLQRSGQPIDVANAALFLISEEAAFMTGQVLFIDGGRTIGLSSV